MGNMRVGPRAKTITRYCRDSTIAEGAPEAGHGQTALKDDGFDLVNECEVFVPG